MTVLYLLGGVRVGGVAPGRLSLRDLALESLSLSDEDSAGCVLLDGSVT